MGNEDDDFENVYDDEGREDLQKNDEISPEEEAFMKGYDESEKEDSEDETDDDYIDSFGKDSKSKKDDDDD